MMNIPNDKASGMYVLYDWAGTMSLSKASRIRFDDKGNSVRYVWVLKISTQVSFVPHSISLPHVDRLVWFRGHTREGTDTRTHAFFLVLLPLSIPAFEVRPLTSPLTQQRN